LHEIVSNYVVMQHIFVATAKLSMTVKDTFHFSNDEGVLRWLGTSLPNLNGTKFQNVLNILVDLDLVHKEDNKFTLTKEGKKILSQI